MPQENHADYFRLGPQMCMYPCLARVEGGAVAPFALRKSAADTSQGMRVKLFYGKNSVDPPASFFTPNS